MSIKMVRQPSETPNITNIDDMIPFRYAYGNQNGYVKDKGNEADYTINGSQFTIGSGRLVLQGVESDISASGVTITIDSVNELRYYVVYLQVNLALNTVSILSQYDTAGYPTISDGDDLTQTSTGIANLPLYKFSANNGVIADVEKLVQEITYTGTALVGYDSSKGTIEERLTNLGFREGSVILASGITATVNSLKRQGNYVIGELTFTLANDLTVNLLNSTSGTNEVYIGFTPSYFGPTEETLLGVTATIYNVANTNGTSTSYGNRFESVASSRITSGGGIYLRLYSSFASSYFGNYSERNSKIRTTNSVTIKFGYEANPIT